MTLYLVHASAEDDLPDLGGPAFALRPGLHLVRSPLSRSRLYHRVKRALPGGTALLVAPLADVPKFKGMERGALSFVRRVAGQAPDSRSSAAGSSE